MYILRAKRIHGLSIVSSSGLVNLSLSVELTNPNDTGPVSRKLTRDLGATCLSFPHVHTPRISHQTLFHSELLLQLCSPLQSALK
jgi:hypothetical protein